MPKIQVLSEELINKIAAGEVIERPASVVKELIENSLDAHATRIDVEVKDSGKELIKVSDNGEGMDEEDAINSILRHATSKISSDEDLAAISTLGFRGEALASLAAVSKLNLITKQKDQMEGFSLTVEGGVIVDTNLTATEEGTVMEVKELFFNTPARKKFLKTDAVELRHIIDVVTRYALINPRVAFRLIHNNQELLHSAAVEDMRSNIALIYGTKTARELLELNYESSGIKISGFIGQPSQVRNDKSWQMIYVNGRWIKNEDITKAAYDGYHSLLFVNKHPILILNLTLDPHTIDVNVHPAKTEIKIEQKETVSNAVFTAVKETLQKNNLIPTIDINFEQQTFGPPRKKELVKEVKYSFEPSAQSILEVREVRETTATYQENEFAPALSSLAKLSTLVHEVEKNVLIEENEKFPALKLLGQIHKTFFAAETPGGMFLIDQHAAHERVLYEEFMEQFMKQKIVLQNLLQGEIIEFSPSERISFLEHEAEIKNLGFKLEPFGGNTFVIKSIPFIFGRLPPKDFLHELLTSLLTGNNSVESKKEEIITRMACRAAVMAGDTLTIGQMEEILKDLAAKKFPYTCPHGRPTMIKTSFEELEKRFKRKG